MTLRWRCGEAARRSKPRNVPARPLPRAASGGEASFSNGGRLKWKSTGGAAEQASKHRARDAKVRRTCGNTGFRHASASRGVEARGSEHFEFAPTCVNLSAPDPNASRAPSVYFGAGGHRACRIQARHPVRSGDGRTRRPGKEYGRGRAPASCHCPRKPGPRAAGDICERSHWIPAFAGMSRFFLPPTQTIQRHERA